MTGEGGDAEMSKSPLDTSSPLDSSSTGVSNIVSVKCGREHFQ